jgi:activator of 2-hydroxyglutaryl-CoA dehydratase
MVRIFHLRFLLFEVQILHLNFAQERKTLYRILTTKEAIRLSVLIGNLTLLPQCKDIYPMLEKLYKVRFHIPKYSEFCTAIGAALNYKQ